MFKGITQGEIAQNMLKLMSMGVWGQPLKKDGACVSWGRRTRQVRLERLREVVTSVSRTPAGMPVEIHMTREFQYATMTV